MKLIFTLMTAAAIICSAKVIAQNSGIKENNAVWVTIANENLIPNGHESDLYSSNEEIQSIIETYNIISVNKAFPSSRKTSLNNVYEFNCNCDAELLRNQLDKTEGFERVEVKPENTPFFTPDDYQLEFSNDYALELIGAENAWDVTLGDPSVEIAITDTDFDLTHQELMGSLTVVDTPFYSNYYYHGTAVATTAAGNTNNSIGKSSIGSQCGLQLYNMNYNSILKATYNGAKVINVSWGSCYYSTYAQDVINEAYENGSIIVAAAGNGSTCNDPTALVYPAALDHVISVSSIGPQNNHERTIGDPTTTHQHNDSVDIVAPGYDVALTVADGWYLTGNGTSFAAPYVSGTIGLMLSVNPCLSFEDVENILYSTAYNVDTINPSYAGLLGAGRLDAGAALVQAQNCQSIDFTIQTNYNCSEQAFELVAGLPSQTSIIGDYEWNTGESNRKIFATQTDTYNVKYTSLSGCVGYDTIDLNVPDPLTLNTTASEVSCNGDHNGEIEMFSSGGFGNTQLFFEGYVTNDSLKSNLSPGLYEIKTVDSLGCEVIEIVEVQEPHALEVESVIGCDGDLTGSGYIDITVSGGNGNYMFEWSNGDLTEDLYSISTGDYELTITDQNNCALTEAFNVCGATASIDSQNHTDFNIYPNPSDGSFIQMTWNGNVSYIEIMDETGRLITSKYPQNNELKVTDLATGLYFVRAYQDDQQIALKKLLIK